MVTKRSFKLNLQTEYFRARGAKVKAFEIEARTVDEFESLVRETVRDVFSSMEI